MSPQPSRELGQVLVKIPFFKNLMVDEIGKILELSTAGFYQPGDKIWVGDGGASNEMYILMSGELGVITAQGKKVAAIKPITTVGELGLITSQPRSATVEAVQPSNIHVVPKPLFDELLNNELEIKVKIYRNVIDLPYHKLVNDNVRKRDQQQKPAQAAAPQPTPSAPAPSGPAYTVGDLRGDSAGGSRRSILIIDDEQEIRNLVKTGLASFDIVEAGNGKEALQLVQENCPDLVIADIKMPEMDGITFLNIVRNEHPDLPVLALSGYVASEEILPYSFDGFIAKPLRLEELASIVEETLATGRQT